MFSSRPGKCEYCNTESVISLGNAIDFYDVCLKCFKGHYNFVDLHSEDNIVISPPSNTCNLHKHH